jgi:PAS domain S-box-containing protein
MAFKNIFAGKDNKRDDTAPLSEAETFLLSELLTGMQYFMRGLFVISLPVLIFFTIFNLLKNRYIESLTVFCMLLLIVLASFMLRHKSGTMEQQYRNYKNALRCFLVFFMIYIIYVVGVKHQFDRLQWSFILPIITFLGLRKKESFIWLGFYVISLALLLFVPYINLPWQDVNRDIIFGYKSRFFVTFSIICAAGIAWKYGVDRLYTRLVQRQEQIAASEKQYRDAFDHLNREMHERLMAQAALAESEEKYRQIFENSFDIIYLIDRKYRVINVSPSIQNILGYSPLEINGRPFYELEILLKQDLEKVFRDINYIFSGKKIPLTSYTLIARDGTEHYAEISSSPLISKGEITGLISVARDITARRHAEDALKESLDRFNIIVNNTRDAIWITGMDLKFTFMSPSIEQILGYTAEEYMNKPLEESITPQSMELLYSILHEELEYEKDNFKDPRRSRIVEIEQIHKNGGRIWCELKMSFIKDREGNPVGILGFSRDVTGLKQAEEEKHRLMEHLQHIARIESIGTLAGGIAHDFNNLLMSIQGYTSLIMMNTDPSLPIYNRLRKIEEQIQSGANLTNQLLGFARGGRYEVKPTNMNDIIEKTSSIFGRTRKEMSIHRRYCKDLWTVEVDRGQMEQVLINLYVNSSEAITGSGDIYVETENFILDEKYKHIASVKPGRYIKISVTDTGSGIDENIRDRIFDPFFTTKSMKRGTGLGLSTVYGIVKGHNGMVNVYSEPGHGTTFTIYLPASDKEVEEEKAEIREILTGTETVLLVDDETAVIETNTEILQSLGYTVYPVDNSQEALVLYEKEKDKIDLVILDMIMPGLSGEDLFNHMKRINPGVKILLSSGYSLNGKARSIMDRGCSGFLQKPFDKVKLSNKIREILDGK